MRDRFAVVILAAGAAKRFGSNKLMASYKGKPLFLHTLEKVGELDCVRKIVVTGTKEIASFAESAGFELVLNDSPEAGITRSLKLGLTRCRDDLQGHAACEGVLFCVCDQPELDIRTLKGILSLAASSAIICAGTFERRGNPVFFGKDYFEELMMLQGDQGGKQVMKKHPEKIKIYPVSSIELYDVDTIQDLRNLDDLPHA